VKFYIPDDEERSAAELARSGHLMLYADVRCVDCGKEQALSNTISGRCCACNEVVT